MSTQQIVHPWFFLLGTIALVYRLATCNPVPMPGMITKQDINTGQFIQSTIPTFFRRPGDHEGEGCHVATNMVRAADWETSFSQWAKPSGTPPTVGHGPNQQPIKQPYTQVQKRSYKRACRRAVLTGQTWYKGQCMRPNDFPSKLLQSFQLTEGHHTGTSKVMHHTKHKPRIRILHWNPGGMSQSTFQELKYWLKRQPVDLVIISETRWSFEACWHDTDWSYVHSHSDHAKSGGLLVMIAQRWSASDCIGYNIVYPGRLLHIRLHFAKRATDVIAVYQFTDYRAPDSARHRRQIWNQLTEYISRLPNRNQLICGGDFNCSLITQRRTMVWP